MKTLRKNLLFVLFAVLFVSMLAFVMGAPTAKAEDESVFMMDYGAYARIAYDDEDEGGLRFRVKFTDDVKARVKKEDVTMGFTVMTKANYDAIDDKANYEFAKASGDGVWQVAIDEAKIYSAKDQLTDDVYNYANLLIKASSDFDIEYAVIANIAEAGAYEYADFEEGTNVKSLYYVVNSASLDSYLEDMVRTYDWYGKDYNRYPVKITNANYESLVKYQEGVKNAGLKVYFESDVEDSQSIKADLGAKYSYTVSFVNYDNQTVSSATVMEGESITAPETTPAIGNLTFKGWVTRDGNAMSANADKNATYYTSWEVNDEQDFVAMLDQAKTAGKKEGGFTGYYKLTRDLDLSLVDGEDACLMLDNSQAFSRGWQATFDGDGYALKNVALGWQNCNGLFGMIGYNGVVKNVTIMPIYSGASGFKGYGGVVAYDSAGLIENVYVKVASVGENAVNACLVRFAANNSITRNCVVEYSGANLTTSTLYVQNKGAYATMSNCYAVTTATFPKSDLGTTVESITSLYDTAKDKLSMLKLDGSDILWGNYKIGDKFVETLISSEEEFIAMLSQAKAAASQEGGFTGYYKLTKDLDFTGMSMSSNFMQSNNQVASKGWQATFDGNGYALKNVGMSWLSNTGIFGEIGTNGVIKNLSIINPQYSTTGTFKGYGAIVAHNNFGRIENVYVELTFGGNGSAATAPNAGIVTNGRTGVVTGCLVVDKSASTYTNTGAIVGMLQNNTDLSANAYISTAHTSVTNVNGKTLTDAVKVDAVADIFNNAIKSKLTMLSRDGNDIMWGKYTIGTIVA